jgi:hypothetical protein
VRRTGAEKETLANMQQLDGNETQSPYRVQRFLQDSTVRKGSVRLAVLPDEDERRFAIVAAERVREASDK